MRHQALGWHGSRGGEDSYDVTVGGGADEDTGGNSPLLMDEGN